MPVNESKEPVRVVKVDYTLEEELKRGAISHEELMNNILKLDGSLDIERMNNLPYEEYMDAMGDLTKEQVEEYLSKLPINESDEPMRAVVVD